jgi:preprotein translocase subunit SecE
MAWNPITYFREVRQEASKVVWPGRRETTVTTAMVFIFVVIASIFFLAVDKIIALVVRLLLGVG